MCKCDKLPKFIKADTSDSYFKQFNQIDWKDDSWVKLVQYPDCSQHWQIDEWDKFQTGLAIKVKDPESWKAFDDRAIRVEFLIHNRGGLSETRCAWQGCGNKAIIGLAYCPLCAYEKAKIRE
jgi:hypothetical protein